MNYWLVTRSYQMGPWGDYGDILVRGMAHARYAGEKFTSDIVSVAVQRAGPFVPPVLRPLHANGLLVTAGFRSELESAGFGGLRFLPAHYERVTRVPWQDWEIKSDTLPPELDKLLDEVGGEPEGLILDLPEDKELAARMPPLSFLYPPVGDDSDAPAHGAKLRSPDPTLDFFRSKHHFCMFVSDKAKQWLEQHASFYLSFEPA